MMPPSTLQFCCKCLTTRLAAPREVCERCGGGLLPFLDENGAISRDFLVSRGTCCDNDCRNCPYKSKPSAA